MPVVDLVRETTVQHALTDRNLRYQHASDMRAELQRLKRDTESGHTVAASSGTAAVHEVPLAQKKRLWRIAVIVGAARFALAECECRCCAH
jgi:hypothetical protein